MPAFPPPEQVAYVVSRVAAEVLEDASRRSDTLFARAHDYFPDHDRLDWTGVAAELKTGLIKMAALVEQRERKMLAEGRLVKPE